MTIFCKSEKNRYDINNRNSTESNHDPYINLTNILKLYEQGRIYREMKQNNDNIYVTSKKNIFIKR